MPSCWASVYLPALKSLFRLGGLILCSSLEGILGVAELPSPTNSIHTDNNAASIKWLYDSWLTLDQPPQVSPSYPVFSSFMFKS